MVLDGIEEAFAYRAFASSSNESSVPPNRSLGTFNDKINILVNYGEMLTLVL